MYVFANLKSSVIDSLFWSFTTASNQTFFTGEQTKSNFTRPALMATGAAKESNAISQTKLGRVGLSASHSVPAEIPSTVN